jgi:hypothetical protein
VSEYQEQQADRFCEINPNYCNAKWTLLKNNTICWLQNMPAIL